MEEDESNIVKTPPRTASSGLGVTLPRKMPPRTSQVNTRVISREPVGRRSTSEQSKDETHGPQISPLLPSPLIASASPESTLCGDIYGNAWCNSKHAAQESVSSLHSIKPQSVSLGSTSARHLLAEDAISQPRDHFRDFHQSHYCHSAKYFKRNMNNGLAITIVLLSIFSTVFSGVFLGIAFQRPRYGNTIGSNGTLTVATAVFLTSLFAKAIELAFVTVVVAFVGEMLARRAFQREPNYGVTLAEISMRGWIVQPGSMLTHWETVLYAAPSWLGLLALVSAILAMLYTLASTALVQPQLSFGGWEHRVMQGNVYTSFANKDYIQRSCKTPITTTIDKDVDDITSTCIQIEHAGQSFHNYFQWLQNWVNWVNSGNGSSYLNERPKGSAVDSDNTTMIAPWIEQVPQGRYKQTNWFVNNVTMAMPHPSVASASMDPANGIMQPDQLNGLGIYSVRASVPAPFVNVICLTGLSVEDLHPLVYSEWEEAEELDVGSWPDQLNKVNRYLQNPWLGGTAFDEVFRWAEDEYGETSWPPIFAKLPIDYNTILNDTTGMAWGRNSIYILGKGGPMNIHGTPTDNNYGLCALRVGQTANCSTQYNATSNVGTLEAICEDPSDDLRYIKSLANATTGMAALSAEWPNVAEMWVRSIDLATGLLNGNASNARLWTELFLDNSSVDWSKGADPPDMALEAAFPSPAEALAVMAGCTLIQSARDAPFVEFWNYSVNALDEPQIQYFNASVRAQQYASGGLPGYQQGFGIVLLGVFVINIIVLLYFCIHRDWYVDFSDPTNLFSLAINSPPSVKLADTSCGKLHAENETFKHYWKLENRNGHMYLESHDISNEMDTPRLKKRFSEGLEAITSPAMKATGWFKRSPRVDRSRAQVYSSISG